MKRLLAAGCGPVFQPAAAASVMKRWGVITIRNSPCWSGIVHAMTCIARSNEVDDLLQQVLECQPAESLSISRRFQRHLEIDPLSADKAQLREVAAKLDLRNIADTGRRSRYPCCSCCSPWRVEPHIGKDRPTFIYHFPATQASLAQISPEDHRVAERFEVYYKRY